MFDDFTAARRLAIRASATAACSVVAASWLAAPSAYADPGDPNGNNGTVKIAEVGDVDEIPDTEPHPGCTVTVQWFGFDEGADVVSTLDFELQAPTTGDGYSISTAGTNPFFVGEDPASGAGNDPDGVSAYTLTFRGVPAAQGYHVKLTVDTPNSNGNTTKSKVFWIEGCEAPVENPTETITKTPKKLTHPPKVLPTEQVVHEPPAPEAVVLGTEDAAPVAVPVAVPTAVTAGMPGESHGTGAPLLTLGVIMLGGLAAGGAMASRKHTRSGS